MSDVSALSYEYRASARLAEELNDAVITLKKSRLHHRAGLSHQQRRRLADTLGAVRSRLANEKTGKVEFLPQEMVEKLSGRHSATLAYFLDDLSQATKSLSDPSSPIADTVVILLDEICDAADQAASSMFRRMRRR